MDNHGYINDNSIGIKIMLRKKLKNWKVLFGKELSPNL